MTDIFETERLILRPYREEDLDAVWAMLQDPDVIEFILDGIPATREVAWRLLTNAEGHRALRGYAPWAVFEKDTGSYVGRIGPQYPEGFPGLEICWSMARQHWGKGYATEASLFSIDYTFRNINPDRIISLIDERNVASERVAERLGEKLTAGEHVFAGGPTCRIWEVTREDYASA